MKKIIYLFALFFMTSAFTGRSYAAAEIFGTDADAGGMNYGIFAGYHW